MEETLAPVQTTPCGGPLPELEVPMINAIVGCLGNEHRKLGDLVMQLALATMRLAADPEAVGEKQRVVEVWDELRHNLWPHLQIEDGLVSWGEMHNAISGTLLNTLKLERHALRTLLAGLPALSPNPDSGSESAGDRVVFSRTLLKVVQTLDAHIERYDGELLPSILRAIFHRHTVAN
jgi:hypothetical protein